ncbi:MAG: DUF1549 domain-containing protein [Planctomycetota bacterium]|nr:DUF1549 domain-containing protein [Planctomycetota bacterium]
MRIIGILLAVFFSTHPQWLPSAPAQEPSPTRADQKQSAASGKQTVASPPREPLQKVDFATDIMPLFSRFGCNAAECHGSATGRGDFKLSLFGGDPDLDFRAVVEQLEGRRVHLARPGESLILKKATERLSHGGGERFAPQSLPAMKIRSWIEQGASAKRLRRVRSIAVSRNEFVAGDSDRFLLRVKAHSDIGTRDVTADATLVSPHPSSVNIEPDGWVTVLKPGKFSLLVKYLQFTKTVTIIKPFDSREQDASTSKGWGNEPAGPIDQVVARSYQRLNLPLPPAADESTLVRRLYLDLTGQLPTPEQLSSYLHSRQPDKKKRLVWRLLNSPSHADFWTFWIRKTIRFRIPGEDREAARELNGWIRKQLMEKSTWSEMVSDLVISTGETHTPGPPVFHRLFSDAREEAEGVARSFLGIQIGCANCHRHPLDRWTQEDYHGLAAIFATLKRGKTVTDFPQGTVIQPRTGRPAIPRIPGEQDLVRRPGLRTRFAEWLIDQPQFDRSIVNRVWKHFLGRGVVEPVDDFRPDNPAIDAELLQTLARLFREGGSRFEPLIEQIVTSRLYASRSLASPLAKHVPSYQEKPLSPEVYHDVCQQLILGSTNRRAVNHLDPGRMDASLGLLIGCDGRKCGGAEIQTVGGMRQKIHLINGEFLNRWIHRADSRPWQQYERQKDLMKVLSGFYQEALARPMKPTEEAFWQKRMERTGASPEAQKEFLQDAVWSLVNSREFSSIQ